MANNEEKQLLTSNNINGIKKYATTLSENARDLSRATGILSVKHGGTGRDDGIFGGISESAECSKQGAYSESDGTVFVKMARMNDFELVKGSTFPISFKYENLCTGQIKLNINETGAKLVYINGAITSGSNYQLGKGPYLCRYDGTNYYIDTEYFVTSARNATYAEHLGGATDCYTKSSLETALSGKVPTARKVNNHDLSSDVTITADDVGLGNVTNESKATMFTNAALTGTPTAPTAASDTNNTQIATTEFVQAAINALPNSMVFKGSLGTGGTITSLPIDGSANVGDTYKVITDGTYDSKSAKAGDTIICLTKTSNENTWELIPSGDEPSGTVTSVKIEAISPISIDSSDAITTSGTRKISHAASGATAGSYGDSTDQTLSYGNTFKVPYVTVNETGHVTEIIAHTVKIPENPNTDRYVNTASFADDTTANENSPLKMTLTRAGSDTSTVIANLPKVSSSSAGIVPKGTAVSSQSQSTKFLREDGTWAKPSYTTNTNTTYSFTGGTNKFTVTPSGGTATDITITPSITNNVTGSGTNGKLTKWNGTNTVTDGPAFGSSTTTYLRNDGTWGTPAGTYTHPTTAGNKHIPSGGLSGQFLKYSSAGTAAWSEITKPTTVVCTTGTDSTTSGSVSTADSGKTYYRFKDTDSNWLSGGITVQNGSKGSTGNAVTTMVCVTANGGTTTGNPSTADAGTSYYRFKDSAGNWISGTVAVKNGSSSTSTAQSLTFNNGGSGAASGTTFNGGTARTISYNTIGAAASGHTHTTTIAPSSGTNQLSLSASTKYSITAGGTSYIFTTPADTKNTAGSTDISTKIFLIGASTQTANPQTYSDDQVYVTSGTLQTNITNATSGINANTANSGTAGGVSLYGTYPDDYGIIFRQTSNKEKHGYVQSDWATYLTMNDGGNTRGWVFRQNKTGGNVASISGVGNAVFNGSVTIGGNQTNTSGARMQYNSTTKAIDFVFA